MIKRKIVLSLFAVCFAGLACGTELPKIKLPTLEDLRNRSNLEIKGAKVSKAQDAKNLALGEYFRHPKVALLANEGVSDISILTLGFDVPEFGKTGEKIWEVRIALRIQSKQHLRAIAWIHPQTGKVHFVSGPWQVEKLAVLKVKDTKISSIEELQKLALKTYAEKMKSHITDTEIQSDVSALVLGFDIPDFGKQGETIFEVRIINVVTDGTRPLQAIIWINPQTESAYYVVGPWDFEKSK